MKKLKDLYNKEYSILLLLIITLGAGLRIYNLGTESYWHDEFIMVRVASESLSYIFIEALGGRPPVYVISAHFWIKLFGTSEAATRSLSAIFGIVSIPMMYLVGKQLYNRKLGILSAFLISISQFQIYYSQDFRYYSLFLLTTLCSFYFYINFLKNKKNKDLVVYSIINIILFHTHSYGLFIIFTQNLFILLQYKNFRPLLVKWTLSQLSVLLFMVPNIYLAYFDRLGSSDLYPIWHNLHIKYPLIFIWKYIASGIPWDMSATYPVPSNISIVTGIIFLISISLYKKFIGKAVNNQSSHNTDNNLHLSEYKNELVLTFLWFFCPLIIPFILPSIADAMYTLRYTISASPAFYLLLSLLFLRIEKIIPLAALVGFLLIIIVPGLTQYYRKDFKVPWKEVASYVEKSTTTEEIIIIPDFYCSKSDFDYKYHYVDANKKSFNWYYDGKLSFCCMEVVGYYRNDEKFNSEINRCMSGVNSFWLVLGDGVDHREMYYRKLTINKNLSQTKIKRFFKVRARSLNILENESN